jgi:hypothetical protein
MIAPGCETRVAFASACIVALYAILAFDGADAIYRLWYYTPAAMVVGSLAVDRFKSQRKNRMTGMIDCLVALLCISRPLLGWPAASGHALFFVYALLTASSPSARIFAMILGGVTLYAKIVLWHWDATLWPGLIIGLVAGCLYLRFQKTTNSF